MTYQTDRPVPLLPHQRNIIHLFDGIVFAVRVINTLIGGGKGDLHIFRLQPLPTQRDDVLRCQQQKFLSVGILILVPERRGFGNRKPPSPSSQHRYFQGPRPHGRRAFLTAACQHHRGKHSSRQTRHPFHGQTSFLTHRGRTVPAGSRYQGPAPAGTGRWRPAQSPSAFPDAGADAGTGPE